MNGLRRVAVPLGDRSYEVIVGSGAAAHVGSLMPASAERAAIVTQPGVPHVIETTFPHEVFEIGVGEEHKTMSTVESLCRSFAAMGLTRNDVVVAVGGGMVTDVAGFAAATFHRGVPVLHVPTTLLGMVDAAIGGKTGVNLPEGKNLVGAFWQPVGVVCDVDALATLPERELRCGRGEMAKYHFLTGDDLMALPLDERIARCVEIKAAVVVDDEREAIASGAGAARALLNYGHTLAHALETAGRYDLRHGEAVGIGLVYAAEVAHRLGRIDAGRVEEHRAVVASYDLPRSLPPGADPDELITLMGRDKKALGAVTFVLDGPRGLEIVRGIDRGELHAALEALR